MSERDLNKFGEAIEEAFLINPYIHADFINSMKAN